MPELPDLEVVRELLAARFMGKTLTHVKVFPRGTACLRNAPEEFEEAIGTKVVEIRRRGKAVLFDFESLTFLLEPKLGGRFRVRQEANYKPAKLDCLSLVFGDEMVIFLDSRGMARVQVLKGRETEEMKSWGPEAISISGIPFQYVASALKQHRGEIKTLLLNPRFVSGIGNAYADEILFHAGINPFCKKLSETEAEALWQSIGTVLFESLEILRERIKIENMDQEFRDHLRVHNRGGSPCPRCGHIISEITAGRRLTSFCRECQRGGLEMFDR